jgi:hypothetical protein
MIVLLPSTYRAETNTDVTETPLTCDTTPASRHKPGLFLSIPLATPFPCISIN